MGPLQGLAFPLLHSNFECLQWIQIPPNDILGLPFERCANRHGLRREAYGHPSWR